MTTILNAGRNAYAFWFGSVLVTAGVVLHVPMFAMGRHAGYVLAGMVMDPGMYWGMGLILAGIGCAAYGLLPRPIATRSADHRSWTAMVPPDDAPLLRAHWSMAALLALALIIDVMKPATLGFVTPGMRTEYGIGRETVAWLPFAALTGTVVGSFVWGALADIYGRRASILLIAKSTLIAAPTILISTWLYSMWSTKWSLVAMIGITALGVLGLALRASGLMVLSNPLIPLTLVILGSSGVISILLPYTARELSRARARSRDRLGGRLQQVGRPACAGPECGRRGARVWNRGIGDRRAGGHLVAVACAIRA